MRNFWSRTKNAVGNVYNAAKEKIAKKYDSMKSKAKRKANSLTRRAYNEAKRHAKRFKDYGVNKAKSLTRRLQQSAIAKALELKIFHAGGNLMDSIVKSKYDLVEPQAKLLAGLKYELAQVLDDEETFLNENMIIEELSSTYGALHPTMPSPRNVSSRSPSSVYRPRFSSATRSPSRKSSVYRPRFSSTTRSPSRKSTPRSPSTPSYLQAIQMLKDVAVKYGSSIKSTSSGTFRSLSLLLHPDRNGGDASKTEDFKKINKLKEIIDATERLTPSEHKRRPRRSS